MSTECPMNDQSIDSGREPLASASMRYLSDPAHRRDPYDLLDRLRTEEPVHHSDAGPWIISGHAEALAALRDKRLSRREATQRTALSIFMPGEALEIFFAGLTTSDGDVHARLRSLVARSFTPGAIAAWRPAIADVARGLVDELPTHGETDFVAAFSYPLPERIICRLLGVPAADHLLFGAWSARLTNRPPSGVASDEARQGATDALFEFRDYLQTFIAARRGAPADDLISQLITAEEQGDRLSDVELVSLVMELIRGGHETTANFMANALLLLLQHPAELAELRAAPARIAEAVEEILRVYSPVQMALTRVATEPVEIEGVTIPADAIVIVNLAAANRDPRLVESPDVFDVSRHEPRHLSFGFGEHFCIGATLARAEAQIGLTEVLTRLPGLELAVAVDEIPWRDHALVNAPQALPVRW